ncbi:RNA polymerase subunit sigma-24, partial [Singulisphaera rosea]
MDSRPREINALVDEIYRTESRRIFASLVRLVRDFDLAEEALHEAFAVAVERW